MGIEYYIMMCIDSPLFHPRINPPLMSQNQALPGTSQKKRTDVVVWQSLYEVSGDRPLTSYNRPLLYKDTCC